MYSFAIVGCGRIVRKHIEALKNIERARIAAVCDINIEKAKMASELADNVPYYSSYDDMLSEHDVNIVTILTPSGLHPEHVIDIVQKYRKHIICEKPMALKLEDADRMIECCDRKGVRLFIVKQNRYNLPVQKLKELLDRRELGKLIMGTVRVRWCRTQDYYNMDEWRGTWSLDGGVIANQASHHIDLLEWMLGEPVSVMAMNGTYLVDIEADDTCAALIRFRNGAIGIVEATTATRPNDLEGSLSILGEKGSIVIGGFAVNKLDTWNIESITEQEKNDIFTNYSENPPNIYGFGHQRYIENVMDSIRNGTQALVDGFEGRKSIELINAIYESAETGKEVYLHSRVRHSKLGG